MPMVDLEDQLVLHEGKGRERKGKERKGKERARRLG